MNTDTEDQESISINEASRLELARDAFENNDAQYSKDLHTLKKIEVAKEKHKIEAGETLSSVVFGGLDGIITTFAVVTAAAAAHLTRGTILILGFANLLGDALGMGIGDFISSKAEYDHVKAERRREEWEIENCIEEEKGEMKEIYEKRGLSTEQATEVVDLLLEDKKVFLDRMMVDELGLLPPDEPATAAKNAGITTAAFFVFGGLPLIAFLAAGEYSLESGFDTVFIISIVLFAVALFFLGCYRGVVTGKRWYITGFLTLFNGALTTGAAWLLGYLFDKFTTI
eukprot:TRINITY_DN526_c0_g1_i2.p1 TRINITY_DN526_c0_g1~~TRINITY_DN526_c0_g1_i2.p1  ORF type:complete len:285 (+),score=61.91 TRINITY_DN526_c0_g1_i2:522-1376(+)